MKLYPTNKQVNVSKFGSYSKSIKECFAMQCKQWIQLGNIFLILKS